MKKGENDSAKIQEIKKVLEHFDGKVLYLHDSKSNVVICLNSDTSEEAKFFAIDDNNKSYGYSISHDNAKTVVQLGDKCALAVVNDVKFVQIFMHMTKNCPLKDYDKFKGDYMFNYLDDDTSIFENIDKFENSTPTQALTTLSRNN